MLLVGRCRLKLVVGRLVMMEGEERRLRWKSIKLNRGRVEEDRLAESTGSETSTVDTSEVGVEISVVGEAMVGASTASI
jgi:hypothetical protein